jgi:hypothetical protein
MSDVGESKEQDSIHSKWISDSDRVREGGIQLNRISNRDGSSCTWYQIWAVKMLMRSSGLQCHVVL